MVLYHKSPNNANLYLPSNFLLLVIYYTFEQGTSAYLQMFLAYCFEINNVNFIENYKW